ncbi:MAG TPA: hypothetical protein VEP90_23955 [Methylomirabilota bacterium]|nr:hypothetical protein [Methylomirabilota bacterium]HYT45404.1 hypothetical protein [Methylomirabilota bacterium]
MNDKYFTALDKATKAWKEYCKLMDAKAGPLCEAQEALWHNYCEDALKYNNTSSPKENA